MDRINQKNLANSWNLTVELRHAEGGQTTLHVLDVVWAALGDAAASRITVVEPASFAGTTVLTREKLDSASEDQAWVVFPTSTPSPLPVPRASRGQRVLGSGFTHWDLQRLLCAEEFDWTALEADPERVILEGVPRENSIEFGRSARVRLVVRKAAAEIERIEYFNAAGAKYKEMEVLAWTDEPGRRIPRHQRMTDHRSGSVTDMLLRRHEIVPPDQVRESDFETEALEDVVSRFRAKESKRRPQGEEE